MSDRTQKRVGDWRRDTRRGSRNNGEWHAKKHANKVGMI